MICAERQKIKIRHGVGAICGPRSGFGLFPHPLSAHTVAAIVGVIEEKFAFIHCGLRGLRDNYWYVTKNLPNSCYRIFKNKVIAVAPWATRHKERESDSNG